MGRPRKPSAELKLCGTWRADRHGDRADEAAASGAAQKPDWLDGDAAAVWGVIVGSMAPGVYRTADEPLLAACCRWYAVWRLWDAKLKKGAKDQYKAAVMASLASKQFMAAAAKLGLSPVDRAKLTMPPEEKPRSGKSRFFAG